jgi:alkanesulfonate monooxygenase SsuD/methylene tetrahydromethanopterin reductase-like flavin-dependent oxidoreductase (luciferase family)
MKFGLFGGALAANSTSSDSQNYRHFIDYTCEADRLGIHSVFVVEHHFTGLGQVSATLSLLAYLAARTERIRLGTGVVVLPWHNPVLVAEQIATLDLLSNGRADIGVGKGYRPHEFKGFCMPPEEAGERYEETLAFLQKAWTAKERFSHAGPHWRFDDIIIEPAPVQQPHPPIWVGAGSPDSIRKAARRNFNLLLDHWAPPDVIEQRIATYRTELLDSKRSFTPSRIAVARAVQITHEQQVRNEAISTRARFLLESGLLSSGPLANDNPRGLSLEELAWATAEKAAVVGSTEEVVKKLQALQSAGVEYVLLTDAGTSIEALRIFAREVMPEFADAPKATAGLARA